MTEFDVYFQSGAVLNNKPVDWSKFWLKEIDKLKKVPIDTKTVSKKTVLTKSRKVYELEFNGIDKYRLHARLILPMKFMNKPKVLVVFPDYNETADVYVNYYDMGFAVFILSLRGHREHEIKKEAAQPNEQAEEEKSYGYFKENLLQKESYYLRNLYLDAIRALEVVRLQKDIDKQNIFVLGTGIGACMSIFLQSFMPRARRLFLFEPSYANISLLPSGELLPVKEIKEYLSGHRSQKKDVENTLKYFDIVHFLENINTPVSMFIDFKLKNTSPGESFAIFHAMKNEKDMHIFMEKVLKSGVHVDEKKTIVSDHIHGKETEQKPE